MTFDNAMYCLGVTSLSGGFSIVAWTIADSLVAAWRHPALRARLSLQDKTVRASSVAKAIRARSITGSTSHE